jgi:hypothetical protein
MVKLRRASADEFRRAARVPHAVSFKQQLACASIRFKIITEK